MTTAVTLIAAARQFLGVRFTHQGRTASGLDCLGLLLIAAEQAGVTIQGQAISAMDIPHYGARPDIVLLQYRLGEALAEVPPCDVRVGDVVLLKIEGSPQHLALITDYPMAGELGMIHAYAPARKVVEHRYAQHWREVTYRAYRPDFVA